MIDAFAELRVEGAEGIHHVLRRDRFCGGFKHFPAHRKHSGSGRSRDWDVWDTGVTGNLPEQNLAIQIRWQRMLGLNL